MAEECPGCDRKLDRERIRDRVIHALKDKGFEDARIDRDVRLVLEVGDEALEIRVEAMVHVQDRPAMMVKCVPGNLAPQERGFISIARLFPGGTIPVVIVANHADAVALDATTGRVLGQGYDGLPSLEVVERLLRASSGFHIPQEKLEREKRILLAYYHLRCAANREPF